MEEEIGVVKFKYQGVDYYKDPKTGDLYDIKTQDLKYSIYPAGSGRYAEVIEYDTEDENDSDDSEDELFQALMRRPIRGIEQEKPPAISKDAVKRAFST